MTIPTDSDERSTAIGFMYMGWSYLISCEALVSKWPVRPWHTDSVIAHLAAQGIELLLKSHLRSCGVSVSDLAQRQYGHGLRRLLCEAQKHNLTSTVSREDDEQLSRLDREFGTQPYMTRYPCVGGRTSVDVLPLLTFGRRVMDEIEKRLMPDRVKSVGLSTNAATCLPPANRPLTIEQAVALLDRNATVGSTSPLNYAEQGSAPSSSPSDSQEPAR